MALGGLSGMVSVQPMLHAQDRIMGQVHFVDAAREAKTWESGSTASMLDILAN